MNSGETFHPVSWTAWLVAAGLPALSTRNPLYLSLVLLAAVVTFTALKDRSPAARSWGAFVRLGATLWLFTIPFALLTVHYGRIVLFRLPESWPVVGGPITAEALIYGFSSGLALVTLLLVFAVFNLAVDQASLLRLTPSFIYQTGVVAAIAVAFVPQMVAAWQDIREAQEVRGHRVRGVRDLLPLILPLLVTALERATQLAESMEARGFGHQIIEASPGRRSASQLAVLAGLGAIGIGVAGLWFWPQHRALMGFLVAAGVAFLLWSFWEQGRRVRRTHFRSWLWARTDRLVLAASFAAGAPWLGVLILRADWLFYYPYPPYSPWPSFQPLLAVAIMFLALPGVLLSPAMKRTAPAEVPAKGAHYRDPS
jgi:energy-coupling factor transport system permease protein